MEALLLLFLSHFAPRILWFPILQSVISIHIQVSITVWILFPTAHDEAGACGKRSVKGQRPTTRPGAPFLLLAGRNWSRMRHTSIQVVPDYFHPFL